MEKRAVGRKAAFVAGLGVVVVLAVGAVCHQDFLMHYHLYRLTLEEDYILQLIEKPNSTAGRKAVREFMKEHSGAQIVLGCFVAEFERAYKHKVYRLKDVEKGLVGLGMGELSRHGGRFWHDLRWSSGAAGQGDELSTAPCLIGMVELMAHLSGRELALTGYPALRFQVLRLDEAIQLHGQGLTPNNVYPPQDAHDYVCMIRKEATPTSPGSPTSP